MPTARQLAVLKRLQEFFRSEIQAEVRSEFARLARIPDSSVVDKLRYYSGLSEGEKRAFLDCCAHWATAHYGFVVKMPRLDLADHPFFSKWSQGPRWHTNLD